MMNDDLNDILRKEEIAENPFRVPEGYFEKLHSDVMSKVAAMPHADVAAGGAVSENQDDKPKAKHFWLSRPVRVAAACAIFLVAGAAAMLTYRSQQADDSYMAEQYSDEAILEAAEYAMFDNHDYYQFFEENSN